MVDIGYEGDIQILIGNQKQKPINFVLNEVHISGSMKNYLP